MGSVRGGTGHGPKGARREIALARSSAREGSRAGDRVLWSRPHGPTGAPRRRTLSAPHPPAAGSEPRISTGNAELDRMMDGGLLPHRPYVVVGPSGTGKTTLALQFLCEGVRRGEAVLLVTLEEPPNEARWNHRSLLPYLGKVHVFDAIPDVMRYERAPYKDIASVRASVPFDRVDLQIRQTPEMTSVEVTITGLEQMLRMEVQRKAYTRIVVDSLTALQVLLHEGPRHERRRANLPPVSLRPAGHDPAHRRVSSRGHRDARADARARRGPPLPLGGRGSDGPRGGGREVPGELARHPDASLPDRTERDRHQPERHGLPRYPADHQGPSDRIPRSRLHGATSARAGHRGTPRPGSARPLLGRRRRHYRTDGGRGRPHVGPRRRDRRSDRSPDPSHGRCLRSTGRGPDRPSHSRAPGGSGSGSDPDAGGDDPDGGRTDPSSRAPDPDRPARQAAEGVPGPPDAGNGRVPEGASEARRGSDSPRARSRIGRSKRADRGRPRPAFLGSRPHSGSAPDHAHTVDSPSSSRARTRVGSESGTGGRSPDTAASSHGDSPGSDTSPGAISARTSAGPGRGGTSGPRGSPAPGCGGASSGLEALPGPASPGRASGPTPDPSSAASGYRSRSIGTPAATESTDVPPASPSGDGDPRRCPAPADPNPSGGAGPRTSTAPSPRSDPDSDPGRTAARSRSCCSHAPRRCASRCSRPPCGTSPYPTARRPNACRSFGGSRRSPRRDAKAKAGSDCPQEESARRRPGRIDPPPVPRIGAHGSSAGPIPHGRSRAGPSPDRPGAHPGRALDRSATSVRSTTGRTRRTFPGSCLDRRSIGCSPDTGGDARPQVRSPSGPASVTTTDGVPPPIPAKPKRRVVRKKKAPPVLAATPGPVPPVDPVAPPAPTDAPAPEPATKEAE